MLTVSLTPLTLQPVLEKVQEVHSSIKARLNLLNIPIVDVYADFTMSQETSATLFEEYPQCCDHYGSALSFYQAFCKLNYLLSSVYFLRKNSVDFSTITITVEDLVIVNSFSIFKGAV